MIRDFSIKDIDAVMKLWLDTNIQAHDFIESSYWNDNFKLVKEMMPQAMINISEFDNKIQGFIGITGDYIAGIFVSNEAQSKGIGKQLLDHVKDTHSKLSLQVYKKNDRAVRFYLREGFTISSEQIDETTGEIEFVMEWKKQVYNN
ncbi:N-acetyltransferase [Tissierella praeacuta]|uniref:N-acetyltransferase n=1 Tax=Tissierella praeacuta TaxID=43131 RepID=UPI0033402436